jgi:hypothetical protein
LVFDFSYLATGKVLAVAVPLKVLTPVLEEDGTNALALVETVAAMATRAIVFFKNTMIERLEDLED